LADNRVKLLAAGMAASGERRRVRAAPQGCLNGAPDTGKMTWYPPPGCMLRTLAMVLTGANGTGKTSLIRMIAGLFEPAAGRLELEGGSSEPTIGQQCHFVAHQDALKPALTAAENLGFWSDFLGSGDVAAGLAAFDLSALAGLQAGFLSAGQKRRLALSRLALTARPLWLLDEPPAGGRC
jgi:heme ABC exporter ATP-binding subunit CcmA